MCEADGERMSEKRGFQRSRSPQPLGVKFFASVAKCVLLLHIWCVCARKQGPCLSVSLAQGLYSRLPVTVGSMFLACVACI